MRLFIILTLLTSSVASFSQAPATKPLEKEPKKEPAKGSVPDTGSPALLLGVSLAGVALAGRFFVKKNR